MSDSSRTIAVPGLFEDRGSSRLAGLRIGFLSSLMLTALAMFGLVWILVASLPMAYMPRDYPLLVVKRTLLDACRPGLTEIYGDSRALVGFEPNALSVPAINEAFSGSSPIETFYALRRALRCVAPPKLVIIAHSPLTYSHDPLYWDLDVKVGLLDLADMREVDTTAASVDDHQTLRHDDHLSRQVRELLFAIRFPGLYFDSLLNGAVIGRWKPNLLALKDAMGASGQAFFGRAPGSSDIASEAGVSAFRPSPLIDAYFTRTLELLAKHHVPTIVLMMPINQSTFRRTSPAMLDQVASYLRARTSRFANVSLLGAIPPCWPDRDFGDAYHLNPTGADAFSHALDPILEDRLNGRVLNPVQDRCGRSDGSRPKR